MSEISCDYEAELVMCRKEIEQLLSEYTRLEKEKTELLVKLDDYDKTVRYLQGQVKAYEFVISKGVYTKCQ